MASAPRVLVLNERDAQHPRAGGAEVHVTEIFRRLASRGFDITFTATSFPGGAGEMESDGMRIRRLGRIPYYYPRAVWNCARETRSGRYDVVVECLNKLPFYAPLYSAVPVLAIAHHLFGEAAFLQVPWPVATTVSHRTLQCVFTRRRDSSFCRARARAARHSARIRVTRSGLASCTGSPANSASNVEPALSRSGSPASASAPRGGANSKRRPPGTGAGAPRPGPFRRIRR